MKILLLTTACGEGHNAMARAYDKQCKKQGHQTEIYDIFGDLPREQKLFNGGYIFMVKHFPKLYQKVWRFGRSHPRQTVSKRFVSSMKRATNLLQQKIQQFAPDVIMSLHVNCGASVEILRSQNKIDKNIKHIAVVFDYVICPEFEYSKNADFVITPSEICHKELVQKGFDANKLLPFGFPVDEKFLCALDKKTARQQLNIKDTFTVLTIAGGAGIGKTLDLIKSIVDKDKEIQIIAICGRNKVQKEKIDNFAKQNNLKNIIAYGFTDQVANLMSSADLIFTRGGGNGISECFYAGRPIIFRNGLINNEYENMKIFVAKGMGDCIKNNKQAGEKAVFYKNNPQLLEKMEQNIKDFVKQNPTETAINFVQNLK